MSAKTNLTNNRYGRWFVIKLEPPITKPRHRTQYWCRCDCGTERLVQAGNLTSGMSTSCGCKQRESLVRTHEKTRRDITGQRFGMLTAVRRVGIKPTMWLCKCDCEGSRVTSTYALRAGGVRNCGCTRKFPKLSDKDVVAIRALYKLDDYTLRRIAKVFAVDESHISRIVNGKVRSSAGGETNE